MTKWVGTKAAAMVLCGVVGVVLAGGCSGVGSDGSGSGAAGGMDAFTGIDPTTLNNESLKASALSFYLTGDISSSSGVDASTDEATLEGIAGQDAPMAQTTVDDWLGTVDPSTIPTAGVQPKYECTDSYSCPYATKCFNAPYSNISQHNCWVVNCGNAACTSCPSWFPPFLKTLIFKSWCAYVCTQNQGNVVAVGAVGVKEGGDPFPAKGAWCFDP